MKIISILMAAAFVIMIPFLSLAQEAEVSTDESAAEPKYYGSITKQEWESFSNAFMDPVGRIKDNKNEDMTHSEGQGYGLLLAWMAGDQEDFERIISFTRRELVIRDDGLVAWGWKPGEQPRVFDINSASDGDILIAYALSLAGETWGRDDYTAWSEYLRSAIAEKEIMEVAGRKVILPGAEGFHDDEGTVLNPSYWVDEAIARFAAIDPEGPWSDVRRAGKELNSAWASISKKSAPAGWVMVNPDGTLGEIRDDERFAGETEFGYNALRVPLYMIRNGDKGDGSMRMMANEIIDNAGNLVLTRNGQNETPQGGGYKALASLISCVSGKDRGATIPSFSADDYYPSVVHLLSLSAARVEAKECRVQGAALDE